jgi:hypothetical protein
MSNKSDSTVATIGIDVGRNSFHVVGLDRRGAIVLRQKWSHGQVEARLAAMSLAASKDSRAHRPDLGSRSLARWCVLSNACLHADQTHADRAPRLGPCRRRVERATVDFLGKADVLPWWQSFFAWHPGEQKSKGPPPAALLY